MAPVELQPYDAADYLTTEAERLSYLSYVLEEGEPFDIAAALGAIARSKGLTEAAEAAGLDRFSLYREGEPFTAQIEHATLVRIIHSLGYRLLATEVSTPTQEAVPA